jgi:AraC-like DNA-binding protein
LGQQISLLHLWTRKEVSYEPHRHSEYTIMVCLGGELTKSELRETQAAGVGEAFITNSGSEHSTTCRPDLSGTGEAVCLSFSPQILAAMGHDFGLPTMPPGHIAAFTGTLKSSVIQECARAIIGELAGRTAGYKVVVGLQAMRLVTEVLRAWPRSQIRAHLADSVPRLSQHDFLRAYEYIRSCRKDSFRLQGLCGFLGLSKERFTRLFLNSTGQTPASFYNRMLLKRGLQLLGDSSLSVKEICFELGYKTNSHFIVAFRREFNTTPQELRLNRRLNPDLQLPRMPTDWKPARLLQPA